MRRNNLSRRGGNSLLPFMHRAGLFGELRLSSWMVLSHLWPLSIPIYHFPTVPVLFSACSWRTLAESHPASVFKDTFAMHCYSSDTCRGWSWKWGSPTQYISFTHCCWNAGSAPRTGSWSSQGSQLAESQPDPWTQHTGRSWTRSSWHSSAEGSRPFSQCVCYQVKGQQLIVEKLRKFW